MSGRLTEANNRLRPGGRIRAAIVERSFRDYFARMRGWNRINADDSFLNGVGPGMAKSSKLVAAKRGRVLLVRRRRDRLWMFPGGRRRASETEKDCLRREIREELPELKLGRLRLWKEVKAKKS